MSSLVGRRCTVEDPQWSDAIKQRYAGMVFTIVAVGTLGTTWSVLLEHKGEITQFYPGQLRLL